jgi:Ca2+-binding RTX toxin-like protein
MKERHYRRVWRSCWATVLGVTAMCLVPSAALGAEWVKDGGFEASTCDATECTSPAWSDNVTTAFTNATGPICRSGTGAGNTDCNGGGSAPFGGSTWARLGAGYTTQADSGSGVTSGLEQTVSIPTTPVTLSFRLRIIDAVGPTGQFEVVVGGSQVFSATDATPGFAAYAPVTIDVSSHAGTAPLLRLQGTSSQMPIGPLDSFDVDDVSLTTVDPVPPCAGRAPTAVGTAGADKMTGTPAAAVIDALGGNDTVKALGGNDVVCGGPGKDTLKGGGGKDRLLGQKGKDNLKGGKGKDTCKGAQGRDTASACEVAKSI